MKKRVRVILGLMIIITIYNLYGTVVQVKATPLVNHEYACQEVNLSNLGGYFYSKSGQSALYSNWSSNNPDAFITNEMWIKFSDYTWIETGDVDGDMNGNYFAGRFYAYKDTSGFHEFSVGSSYPSGGCPFEVQYAGNLYWDVYVNGSVAKSLYITYATSPAIKLGIETSDTGCYFTSGFYDYALQIKDTNKTWKNWTTTSPVNLNNLGWKSVYDSNSNRVTFTR